MVITFIAIQENINSSTRDGMEILPFYSIFNEWYAAQTSKKIRAVNELKASQGKRVASTVAFGYKKSESDKEEWIIDEPAAEVVRKIYALFLGGKGPSQIARQLEAEKVLTPTAYFHSVGKKTSNPVLADIYGWNSSTVTGILDNRQYTGCTVNGKSSTVSYKVHKVIEKPKEEYQIIPNTQESIIEERVWLRVQELRNSKRRNTKTGRTSLFSGLVFCADCGAKLHFCASKSLKCNQEFFRCANYKDGRGNCSIHFIRDVVLQQIVYDEVSALADFVKTYGSVFQIIRQYRQGDIRQRKEAELRQGIGSAKKRISEIDKLFSRIYEDNVLGKLDDNLYTRMAGEYEREQKELEAAITQAEQELDKASKETVDYKLLYQGLAEFLEIKELTPEIVNKVIKRIEVHSPEKKHSHNCVKIDITFTAIGFFRKEEDQELLHLAKTAQENPQILRQFSA